MLEEEVDFPTLREALPLILIRPELFPFLMAVNVLQRNHFSHARSSGREVDANDDIASTVPPPQEGFLSGLC